MLIRHRPPSIFSIYMVDILCCALGCVILLWQLYHVESQEQTAAAQDALSKLAEANINFDDLASERDDLKNLLDAKTRELDARTKEKVLVALELDGLRGKFDRERQLALVLQSELDALRKTHQAAEAMLATFKADLATASADRDVLLKKNKLTSAELAAKLKAYAAALDKSSLLEQRLTALEKELDLKALELKLSADKADLSAKDIADADARAKKLEALLAELKAEGKESLAKLSVSDLRLKLLEQQLDLSRKNLDLSGKRIEQLLTDKERLALQLLASTKNLDLLKEAADRRFEGITLEGRKVAFLIDVSGSMVMSDRETPDPAKWAKVVKEIERVASSLVDAEHFSVVVFSSRASYLFGDGTRWEKFDRESSPKRIGDALRALRPEGGTNVYAGLEKTFAYRRLGLETVFFFSDGLPTEGPGLSDADARLSDTAQSEKLGKVIRSQLANGWNAPIAGQRVPINAVGFFFESPDVGAFLWALARENEGSFVGMSRP